MDMSCESIELKPGARSGGLPPLRRLARRVVDCEQRAKTDQGRRASFAACEKLGQSLAMLVGNTGMQALLSRALTLAAVEVSWLRVVQVRVDGSIEAQPELDASLRGADSAAGVIAVLTHLLELLVSFIGMELVLGLVRELWPDLPMPPEDEEGTDP